MKELTLVSCNTFVVDLDEGWLPTAEVVVGFTEHAYSIDAAGHVNRSRDVIETFRFGATEDSLRKLAERLEGFADDLAALGLKIDGGNTDNG